MQQIYLLEDGEHLDGEDHHLDDCVEETETIGLFDSPEISLHVLASLVSPWMMHVQGLLSADHCLC